jgi:hypothetical protein
MRRWAAARAGPPIHARVWAAGKGELDETPVWLFFKGVSSSEAEGNILSGIRVVMERSPGVPVLKVQKKLDFYVEELVADHLALMDGLVVALQNGIRNIFTFTNSEKLYFQASVFWEGVLVSIFFSAWLLFHKIG